eukprot:SAG31_NODE_18990_length_615_cov_1.236434_1_plen_160_part_01
MLFRRPLFRLFYPAAMPGIAHAWQGPAVLTRKNWYIGAILATGGALSGSLGDNLVRKGHSTSRNWLVVIGNLCTVLLNTGFTLSAMAFADASLVIPFERQSFLTLGWRPADAPTQTAHVKAMSKAKYTRNAGLPQSWMMESREYVFESLFPAVTTWQRHV